MEEIVHFSRKRDTEEIEATSLQMPPVWSCLRGHSDLSSIIVAAAVRLIPGTCRYARATVII